MVLLVACLFGSVPSFAQLRSAAAPSTGSFSSVSLSADTSAAHRIARRSISDGTIWRTESDVRRGRMYAVAGVIVAADVAGIYKLASSWYESPHSAFHFHSFDLDSRGYKQQDKFGHAMSSYYLTTTSAQAYRWAGLSWRRSVWTGAATASAGLLQVEIADGFHENWGFSLLDLGANTFGAALAVAQQLDPHTFGGIRMKISYRPSEAFRDGLYPPYSDTMVDDYEGQIFWMAANVHGVLPVSWRSGFPGWLQPFGVAVGHSASGIANDVFGGERQLFLALDLDLSKIPVGDNRFLQFLRSQANFIHLPLPGIRFSQHGPVFGFFF